MSTAEGQGAQGKVECGELSDRRGRGKGDEGPDEGVCWCWGVLGGD